MRGDEITVASELAFAARLRRLPLIVAELVVVNAEEERTDAPRAGGLRSSSSEEHKSITSRLLAFDIFSHCKASAGNQ